MRLLRPAVCCIPKPLGKKSIPSALAWSYVIFNDKCRSATIQRAQRHTVKRELMDRKRTLSMWTPCEDRFQNDDALSNGDALSRVLHDYFSNCFTVNILQSNYFPRVTSSKQQLLSRSNYFFRAANFLGQLPFQNTHFFSDWNYYRPATSYE